MIFLDLPDLFRSQSPHTYPPFKNGYYLEEYFYNYVLKNKESLENLCTIDLPLNKNSNSQKYYITFGEIFEFLLKLSKDQYSKKNKGGSNSLYFN